MQGTPHKNATPKTFDFTKPVLNLEEAAAFLQLNTKTLRLAAKGGTIPGKKVGRDWRFSREKLIEMFSAEPPIESVE